MLTIYCILILIFYSNDSTSQIYKFFYIRNGSKMYKIYGKVQQECWELVIKYGVYNKKRVGFTPLKQYTVFIPLHVDLELTRTLFPHWTLCAITEMERKRKERRYSWAELHLKGFDRRLWCHMLKMLVIFYILGNVFKVGCEQLLLLFLFTSGNNEQRHFSEGPWSTMGL